MSLVRPPTLHILHLHIFLGTVLSINRPYSIRAKTRRCLRRLCRALLPILLRIAHPSCRVHIQFGLDAHALQKLSRPASVSVIWWVELVEALQAFFTAHLPLPKGTVSYAVDPRVLSHTDPLSDTPWARRQWDNECMVSRRENQERLNAQATRAAQEGRLEEFLEELQEELASDSEED